MKILYLEGLNKEFNQIIEEYYPTLKDTQHPEVIITCGGDGTVLKTLRYMVNKQINIPFLVLKAGTFNFLPTYYGEDFDFREMIKNVLEDRILFHKYHFSPLKITYDKNVYIGMNDVIVGNNINDYHEFMIKTSSTLLNDLTFKGMGLCVCSSIGSTAFNLHNNGQVFEDKNAFGITNIVSNININDVVVSDYVKVTLTNTRALSNLYIDGSNYVIPIEVNKEIEVVHSNELYTMYYLEDNELINRKINFSYSNRKKM